MALEIRYEPFEFTPDMVQNPQNFADLTPQLPHYMVETTDTCGFQHASHESIHQCATLLTSTFFSGSNMQLIQRRLQTEFLELTGYRIDYQKHEDLVTIMRSIFVTNSRHLDHHIKEQIAELNDKVVATCLPMIARNIEQYIGYIHDASTIPIPIARGEATTIKGTLQLEPRIGF